MGIAPSNLGFNRRRGVFTNKKGVQQTEEFACEMGMLQYLHIFPGEWILRYPEISSFWTIPLCKWEYNPTILAD